MIVKILEMMSGMIEMITKLAVRIRISELIKIRKDNDNNGLDEYTGIMNNEIKESVDISSDTIKIDENTHKLQKKFC